MKPFFLPLLCFFLLASCAENKDSETCSKEKVESLILELPEVKEKEHLVDSISNHKQGVTFFTTEEKVGDSLFYVVQVGYSSPERLETYYTFYVNKNDCHDIRFLDVVTGEILLMEEWRNSIVKTVDLQ